MDTLTEKRLALGQRIVRWLRHQVHLMPDVTAYRGTPSGGINQDAARRWTNFLEGEDGPEIHDSPLGTAAEIYDLLLPSNATCLALRLSPKSLLEKESRLRMANMDVALCQLRRFLRIKASVYLDKKRNSVGQKSGTRSATLLSDYTAKISRTAARYREHRASLFRIDSEGSWQARFKQLNPADVRAAHQNESDTEEHGPSSTKANDRRVWNESSRTISWIWKVRKAAEEGSLGVDEAVATEEEVGEGKNTVDLDCQQVFNFF